MGIFDWIGNGIVGLTVLVISIISKKDNRLDLVLNSFATIFIIQVDVIETLITKYLTESLKYRIEEFGEKMHFSDEYINPLCTEND